MHWFHALLLWAVGAACAAQTVAEVPTASVYTRALLVSEDKKSDGRILVRLKLLPRSKIPFFHADVCGPRQGTSGRRSRGCLGQVPSPV